MKSPFQPFAKLAIILGGIFTGAGIIFAVSLIPHDKSEDAYETIFSLFLVFGVMGVLWLGLGIGFMLHNRKANAKRDRLKAEGARFHAEEIRLIPNYHIRYGAHLTVRAECTYRDASGQMCLVRSGSFLLPAYPQPGGKTAYTAEVYVNRNDPKDYYIEVHETGSMSYDRDYR